MSSRVSVCIATFRRRQRLLLLLEDLAAQTLVPHQVVVVDNDAAGSAQQVVEEMRNRRPRYELVYEIQPERGIARTRNRTVALADGDWLAFIDDDERAPTIWLRQLVDAAHKWRADGVIAPIVCQLPPDAPRWIQAGQFYVRVPRLETGSEIPSNRLLFGNIILRGGLVRAEPGPFNVDYGLNAGEDADLLLRLIARGGRMIWCDEAIVYEPVEPARLSLRYLMQRSYSGGQEFGRKTLSGRYGAVAVTRRTSFFANCLAKLILAVLLIPLSLPAGRHHAARWLIVAAGNVGKLTAFLGWKYQLYRVGEPHLSKDPR